MNSLCSGSIHWHRDHDTLVLTVFRMQEVVHPSGEVFLVPNYLAEIALGDSIHLTEGGVNLHIRNEPIAMGVVTE